VPDSQQILSPGDGQVTLQLATQSVNGAIQQLLGSQVELQAATLSYAINEPAVVTMVFTSHSASYLDTLRKVQLTGDPKVLCRIGTITGSDTQWQEWQDFWIFDFDATPQGIEAGQSGYLVKLTLKDALWRIDRVNRTLARHGRISDVVASIAADHDLDALVEPTVDDVTYFQIYQSDIDFIHERLMNLAANDKGRSNYRLYVRDNVLHFHTRQYKANLKAFNFYRSERSLGLKLIDASSANSNDGGAGVSVTVYNVYDGSTKTVYSDPNIALRLGNTIPSYPSEFILPTVRHAGANPISEADYIANSIYQHKRHDGYVVRLATNRTLNLGLNDLLNLQLSAEGDKNSAWAGLYSVGEVKHVIKSGTLSSVFTLERGETLSIKGGKFNAPGQDINLAEVSSGGVSKTASGSRTVAVLPAD